MGRTASARALVPASRATAAWPVDETRARRLLGRLCAWMIVLPVDAVAILTPALLVPEQLLGLEALAVVGLALLTGGRRYRARLHISVLDDLPTLLANLLAAIGLVVGVLLLLRGDVTTFLPAAFLGAGLVVVGRTITTQAIRVARTRGLVARPTVFVGGGGLTGHLAELLVEQRKYGLRPIGFVDDRARPEAERVIPRLADFEDLAEVVASCGVQVIIVSETDIAEPRLVELVRRPPCRPCDLLVVPRLHSLCTQAVQGDHIACIPIMRIRTPSLRGPSAVLKRSFDVVFAAVTLVLLAPVLGACTLAVRIETGGSPLFRQERVGRDGRVFTCLKFRTLAPRSGEESATLWSVATDPRVGPVGRFLRRTSLDELPQLWNILRGDMTTVGPRPERPYFVEKFAAELPGYGLRHRVPSGLTGLAQVSGLRGDTSVADRARFDNFYIENWSPWLDVKVLLRTVIEVVFARGR
ncbi:sugar transferase [Actinomycetospora cinnamomea]|uniref:Exopolysaccharide biosynthesis polyprenyl glycosylphosphotransferase n=1 Tax=Actinomycetospora cinnamomea TaxID=663609 RepID=A0A2U1EXB8_9PSEU|nr:sugar transferase [Actinomycetospora cinnamomea]PVZ04574.1 exopolysaccharide biosynthesis polyprenyl glycosylphosphotransferase [Actinomycetospora cinnamomea]